jgi:uroporphyrinogen-III decarboxylase
VSSWLQALNDYELYKIHAIADPALMPVAMVADDLAYNKGLLFSPEFLRRESFPRAKRLVDAWHEHGCRVIFFCDGNKWAIMDDLVALGCDSIAPLEPDSHMLLANVRRKYPQLTEVYTIDSNDLLSYGSPEDVRAAVREAATLGADGGLILASTSALHPAVRLENAIALFDAARQYGDYGRQVR